MMDARLHLRRAASSSEIVICDLTWSDSMADELFFEFDAVIVPTSVAEIELASTTRFLNNRRWVFDSKNSHCPDLLLCPSRVHMSQLENNAFIAQRFAVSFLLSPPVLESQSARDCYETGYLMDLANECGQSFIEFAKAVNVTREIRRSRQALNAFQVPRAGSSERVGNRHRTSIPSSMGHHKQHAISRLTGNSFILGKHHLDQARTSTVDHTSSSDESVKTNNSVRSLSNWMRLFTRNVTPITKS
jgi:hypothetical protein